MAPDLKRGDTPDNLNNKKFVRVGTRIYYADIPGEEIWHSDLAFEIGVKPNRVDQFPVDDAGKISEHDGKVAFGGDTTTCKVKGKIPQARKETEKIAKEILGEDGVF